jgi:ankyrin repeat protein
MLLRIISFTIKLLLNDESIMLRDNEGRTCLHLAAEQGALLACKTIIQAGGTRIVNERDNKKLTPLHCASISGQARAIKILIDSGGILFNHSSRQQKKTKDKSLNKNFNIFLLI